MESLVEAITLTIIRLVQFWDVRLSNITGSLSFRVTAGLDGRGDEKEINKYRKLISIPPTPRLKFNVLSKKYFTSSEKTDCFISVFPSESPFLWQRGHTVEHDI